MGFLNNFQLSKGARTPAGSKTYVTGLVANPGTVATSGSQITFSNLTMELDGRQFTQTTTLDMANLGTLVAPGQTYMIFAVPQYQEYPDQTSAEAAGLNYYISNDQRGEGIAYRFFPSAIDSALTLAGGLSALETRVLGGVGSVSDVTVYNAYYEYIEKFRDPRYTMQPLLPIGYQFVLGQMVYLDNSAKENAFFTKTYTQFLQLTAQLGQIRTFRKVVTTAQAQATYGNFLWLIQNANGYGNQNDALINNNPTNRTAAIQAALAAGTPYTFTDTYLAIDEYTVPSTTDMGQTFSQWSVQNWLDRQSSSYLGRINPIFLNQTSLIGSARVPVPTALSRLTYFADPTSLVQVTLGGTAGALTYAGVQTAYDNGIF